MVTSNAKFALNTDKILEEMPLKDVILAKTSTIAIPDEPTEQQEEPEPVSPYVVDRVSVISQEIEKSDNPSVEE